MITWIKKIVGDHLFRGLTLGQAVWYLRLEVLIHYISDGSCVSWCHVVSLVIWTKVTNRHDKSIMIRTNIKAQNWYSFRKLNTKWHKLAPCAPYFSHP